MVALWSESHPERCVECGAPLDDWELAESMDVCWECCVEATSAEMAQIEAEAAAERTAQRLAAAEARRAMRETVDEPVW